MAHLKKVQGEWVEVNRLLATPEVRGSNPVIGKLLYGTFVDCQLYWKDENKEKKAGMAHLKKVLGMKLFCRRR